MYIYIINNKTIAHSIQEHQDRVSEMLLNGQTIVILRDNDNASWNNGWADFLSENYNYTNLNDAFRVNLLKPKVDA